MDETRREAQRASRRRFLEGAALVASAATASAARPLLAAEPRTSGGAKRDRWSQPFRRMVAFGESHVTGISATRPEYGWVSLVKGLIDRFQHDEVELINRGLGADVLSRQSPLYEEYRGRRPIGIERYRRHVIETDPDLVILAYGYNDMQSGTPVLAFMEDLQVVLTDIQEQTKSLVVLLDTYFVADAWHEDPPREGSSEGRWKHGSREKQLVYNRAIEAVAAKNDLLCARIYEALEDAEWLICEPSGPDIHLNDLGHQLVANRVFETLASNCSGLALKAAEDRRRVGKSPWRYGPEGQESRLIRDFYPESKAFLKEGGG